MDTLTSGIAMEPVRTTVRMVDTAVGMWVGAAPERPVSERTARVHGRTRSRWAVVKWGADVHENSLRNGFITYGHNTFTFRNVARIPVGAAVFVVGAARGVEVRAAPEPVGEFATRFTRGTGAGRAILRAA